VVKQLIQKMYSENPPWLVLEHNLPKRQTFVIQRMGMKRTR
jgi:hypothetical protein